MGGWGGWEEKRRLKPTSAKVEVEIEAELGNNVSELSKMSSWHIKSQLIMTGFL